MEARTIAIVASVLGFIFALAGHVAPFWFVFTDTVLDISSYYYGLWQMCGKVSGVLTCLRYDTENPVYTKLIRTIVYLNIGAPCFLLVTSIAIVLASTNKAVRMGASILTGLAGGLLVGSYITFIIKLQSYDFGKVTNYSVSVHFSFFADIIASILAFVACGALVKMTMSSSTVTPVKERLPHQQQMSPDMRHAAWTRRASQHGATPRNPRFAMPPNDTMATNSVEMSQRQARIPEAPTNRHTDMNNSATPSHQRGPMVGPAYPHGSGSHGPMVDPEYPHRPSLQGPMVDPMYSSHGEDQDPPRRMVQHVNSPQLPRDPPQPRVEPRVEQLSVPDRGLYHEESGDSFLSEEINLPATPATGSVARMGRIQDNLNF